MIEADTIARFRFPRPTREDLPRLARLAYGASAVHCDTCRNYHLSMPYLRSLGIGGIGVEFAWESQLDTIRRAISGRDHIRWLIAGSADAGVPALVIELARTQPEVRHELTVVDRCETPLILCRDFAAAEATPIETVQSDLRDFRRDGAFDVVLMHFTTIFFPESEIVPMLGHSGTWLSDNGVLIAGFLHDRPSDAPPSGPSAAMRDWRSSVIREEAAAGRLELPEDIEVFLDRLDKRGGSRSKGRVSTADITEVIRDAGLSPREVSLLPFAEEEAAIWGQDCRQRCFVVARRT